MRVFAKVGIIALLAVLLQGPTAQAERYMLILKNSNQARLIQDFIETKKFSNEISALSASWKTLEVQEELTNIHSLVIDLEDPRLEALLQKLPGVVALEKEVFYPAPKPINGYHLTKPWDFNLAYVPTELLQSRRGQLGPKTPYGISLVRAPEAWAQSNYGAGVRVLILDTGIDKEHPALKSNYEKGKDFVNDGNSPYPEADQVGHGTHVAGTIAASFGADGFVGVAPEARILSGRVCNEGCSNIAVAKGINWGIEEKVDIISMSLGGPFATRGEKIAIEAAEAAGVVVVAASGNDGKRRVSYPAAFPTVLAVGATDSKPAKADFSNWGPELDVVAPGVGVVSSVPVGSGKETIVKVNTTGKAQEVESTGFVGSPDVQQPLELEVVYCKLGKPEDFNGVNVSGRFALIQRGEISFGDKAKNAIAAGARGVVIYNNMAGLIQGAVTQDGSILSIPVVMVTQAVGEALRDLAKNGQRPRVSIQTIKTDYASFDGTSMATPHVAGVLALIKAANPKASPARIREVIKATATPLSPNDDNQVGSGLVNAKAAVEAIVK